MVGGRDTVHTVHHGGVQVAPLLLLVLLLAGPGLPDTLDYYDDYDPNDIPADQAAPQGYSYPVPDTPLLLPGREEEYDDYDPSDIPPDQAAPAAEGYLGPEPEYDDYDPTDIPADQVQPAPLHSDQ